MAVGHQLKKLAQSRGNNRQGSRCIECMPKHWSVYTLIFSTASLLVFCYLFYDVRSSPTSLLLNAGRGLAVLRAQVGDSYLVSVSRASPTQIVTGDGVQELEVSSKKDHSQSELMKRSKSREKLSGNSAPKQKKEAEVSESEVLVDTSSSLKDDAMPEESVEEEISQSGTDLGIIEDSIKRSSKKPTKRNSQKTTKKESKKQKSSVPSEVVDSFNLDPPKEEKLEEPITVDDKSIEEMVAVADALVELEKGMSSESSVTDEKCDFSKGKWVHDENYPLYKPNSCPFVDGGFRCVENGRPSDDFQKWRWQPSGCDLPRFDAREMLERLRGSRMAFVGDSIGRNNWESMLCMLAEAVPNKTRIYEINGEPITKHTGFLSFRFEDYNCTIEYYRSPYLVPQGRAPPKSDGKVRSTLKLDQIDWSSGKWRDADIVVFNSGHWWSFEKTVRSGNYFQEGQVVPMNMTVGEAFRKAMKTVAHFAESSMDAAKSQVFFRSYAPVHFKGGTWDHGGTCNDDTKPLQKFPFIYEDRTCNNMIVEVMESSATSPVNFLNVTYLSELRPDGHSSIWQSVPNSAKNHQDCSHWCLPGVPDTWNEILFATLLKNGKGNWGGNAESES